MEILDGGADPAQPLTPAPPRDRRRGPDHRPGTTVGRGAPRQDRSADPELDFEADLGMANPSGDGPAEQDSDHPSSEVPPGSPLRHLLDVVLGPESLAMAALALDFGALGGGNVLAYVVLGDVEGANGPAEQLRRFITGMAVLAVPSALLALAGLFRLRPDAPRWVRGLTGAAVIATLLILALVGYGLWRASGLPATTTDGAVG
jgi:hypothetical protein